MKHTMIEQMYQFTFNDFFSSSDSILLRIELLYLQINIAAKYFQNITFS